MPKADLSGKTCIITGGNAGIGFATATELSSRGCRVILACRSLEKAEAAAEAIRSAGPRCSERDSQVEVLEVSLSSLQSVHAFCDGFNGRQEPLDFLILNAGVMGTDLRRKTTGDGLEEHFQVNYLSHWLMAHRLVGEQLRRRAAGERGGAPATRVLFLSSSTHVAGNLDPEDLQLEKADYSGFRAYTSSKLANILAARQMQAFLDRVGARRVDAAVAVHPGLIQTSLAAGWMGGSDLAHGFLQPLTAAVLGALSPFILEPASRAARTILYAALAPVDQVGGEYVASGRPRWSSRAARDMKLARKLWDASLNLCRENPNVIEGGSG